LFGSRFETDESFATCCQVVTEAERGREGSKLRDEFLFEFNQLKSVSRFTDHFR